MVDLWEMEDASISYFSSLGSLSQKILFECKDIKNRLCDRWQNLPVDKREELLDQHFIDRDLTIKYASKTTTSETLPDCFPILKIASGEKIVVDFERDENGWTWTDEHSGPFSWRSKSQQDLTLEGVQPGEEISTKKKNSSKISSFKGYVGIENPCGSKNEVEEMFKKFGLRKSFDKENEFDNNDITPDNLGFQGDVAEHKIEPSVIVNNNISPSHLENEKSVLLVSENLASKSRKSAKSSKKKAASGRKRSSGPRERPASPPVLKGKEEAKDLGTYNEVFLDSREPSLEDFLSRPLNDQNPSREMDPPLKKTGLDFLDNW